MRSAADVSGSWSETPQKASRGGLLTVTLVVLAVAIVGGLIAMSANERLLAWDVRFAYLPAAEAVLDGKSPYPALDDPILEEQKGYVYPPQLVLALVPLTPLPVDVVAMLVALALLGMVGLTLWVLGVRDARCYAASVLWVPTISGVLLANVSVPLALALALTWRYRDAAKASGAALGLAVSAKLLLWPMFVWMLATRRLRATALAVFVGAGVTLAAWAAIGFDGLRQYPDLVQRLSDIQAERSYALVGMAATAGLGSSVGQAITLAVGLALLGACVVLARRGDDVRSFTCAVAATLALSPIVWLHYLTLLLVPIAIARPRFSVLWLLPVLLWVSPKPGYAEGFQTFMPGLAAAILLGVILLRPRGVAGPAGATA
jgi:hypothetical protein